MAIEYLRDGRDYEKGEVRYEGLVVDARVKETNAWGHNKYAIVYDPEADAFEKVTTYCYHDGLSENIATAEVDAPEDLQARYDMEKLHGEARKDLARRRMERRKEAREVRKGRKVQVISGEHEGLEGTVIWSGPSKYPPHQERVGVDVDGREDPLWLDASEVKTESLIQFEEKGLLA